MSYQDKTKKKYGNISGWPTIPPEKWEPRDYTKYDPWYVYGKQYDGQPETISTYNPLWGNVDSVYTANPTISSYDPSMYTFNVKKEEANTVKSTASQPDKIEDYATVTSTPKVITDPYYRHPHQLHYMYQPHHPYQSQLLQLPQQLPRQLPRQLPKIRQLHRLVDATRKYSKIQFIKNLTLIIIIAIIVVLVLWYLNRRKYINIMKPIKKLGAEAKTLSAKFRNLFKKTETLDTSAVNTPPQSLLL